MLFLLLSICFRTFVYSGKIAILIVISVIWMSVRHLTNRIEDLEIRYETTNNPITILCTTLKFCTKHTLFQFWIEK